MARLEAATQPGAIVEACKKHGVYCAIPKKADDLELDAHAALLALGRSK